MRNVRFVVSMSLIVACPLSFVLAESFLLGESKDELKLKYELSVYDHDTGRVTVQFTLENEGRLEPITSIDLSIPSDEEHVGGGQKLDLNISMATRKEGTKQVARLHIRKDWAQRAEIQLTARHFDGKQEPLTGYIHSIPLKELIDRAKPHETVK